MTQTPRLIPGRQQSDRAHQVKLLLLTALLLGAMAPPCLAQQLQQAGANYYCSRSLCPGGDAHVGCYSELPFGKACQGLKPEVVPMTAGRKAAILEQHNRQRQRLAVGNLPGYSQAYRMPQLYWDDELQYLAELNARSCVYAHDHCRNTVAYPKAGQNIAIIRHFGLNVTKEQVYRYIIDHWFNEYPLAVRYEDHYPENYVGPDFAHFTQIVNDRAVRMACGMSTWQTYNGYVWTHDYLVCNYAYGNVIGDRSYTKGPVAGGCINGQSPSYPGLCV
ncbi:antigen 5 like allergen Cul n 1-like [Anopheles ziemanni]|uniref:antigen 5 like allergen Cul n 1-like n=1 Tax=Anopheles coustani TaxID=139045 RepID=UPI00265AC1F8|nr:antigen 5 like allergen Cul n 1-like [Anopheles coustani]XP_058175666.1 antigen 5 like allergen Cul n 1-like [Anopheles ziemanni]